MCVEKAAVIVSSVQEKDAPKTTCTITLTSPIMREEVVPEGGKLYGYHGRRLPLPLVGWHLFLSGVAFMRNMKFNCLIFFMP